MGFNASFDICASGLTAQRLRMDIISQNLANAATTRTADGETYRRRVAVFSEQQDTSFAHYLKRAKTNTLKSAPAGRGVKVSSIATDMSDFKIEYDPDHPDADEEGYVAYPNVDEATELVDLMAATRAYEANVTALNAIKSMGMKAMEIGK
ncbi:MAG: flagellar basal body rod protein FlgC [Christensenellales bacterium]|jgi:flagellar basal-body rod protein FlgC